MSVITTNNAVAAVVKGTTWGTEGDITSGGIYLYNSSIKLGGGFAELVRGDVGRPRNKSQIVRLNFDGTVTVSFDWTYGQGLLHCLAQILGTESNPSEVTTDQDDWLVNMDLADDTYGLFSTLCYSIETDRTIVIPSVKWHMFTLSIAPNQKGTVTVTGVADRFREGSANTVAEIQALTKYRYNAARLGGANHYFRINTDAGALDSSDNKTITQLQWTITRDMDKIFGLRGSDTPFTMEPQQIGDTKQSLRIMHSTLNDADLDLWGMWEDETTAKAEFLVDGKQIGSGVNESYKVQWPSLAPRPEVPEGHDYANNNSRFAPAMTFESLEVDAAPTGMSGVTVPRMAVIASTRDAKWGT